MLCLPWMEKYFQALYICLDNNSSVDAKVFAALWAKGTVTVHIGCVGAVAYRGGGSKSHLKFRRPSKIVPNSTRLWKMFKIFWIWHANTRRYSKKKGIKILKLPPVCNCFTLTFGPGIILLILAHPVYEMWIIQEPNTLELWNKLHFERDKKGSIYHV